MNDVLNDVLKTEESYYGISRQYGWSHYDKYSKIYNSSNEDLWTLFANIDVKNKSVLSVLSSGNQALHCLNNGAKSVDVFDINKLTNYFFGLRLISLKYLGTSFLGFDDDFIKNVKKIVNNCSLDSDYENEILDYWILILRKIPKKRFFDFMFRCGNYGNEIDDEKLLIDRVKDYKYTFYNFDLSDNVSECKNKYDVLILSNIHDYVFPEQMELFAENIYKLLNSGGYAITTNFGLLDDNKRMILEKKFIVEDLPTDYFSRIPIGNKLIKS